MPLATYPTNLSELSEGVSQGAYNMARQQFDTAQQNEQLNQRKSLQDLQYADQENPLKLQQQVLANQGQGYLNRQNATKASLGEQTLGSEVDAANSKNRLQLTEDQAKRTGVLAQHLNQLADMVDSGVPLLSVADKLPPELAQVLSQPGGTQRVRDMSKSMALHSQAQIQKMQEVNANNEAATKRTGMQVQGQKDLEQMRIEAGKYKKLQSIKGNYSVESILFNSKTAEQAATGLRMLLDILPEDDPDRDKYANAYSHVAELWQAKLNSTFQPKVDPAATANGGQVVGTQPVQVPGAAGAPQVKKDAQGRILLD